MRIASVTSMDRVHLKRVTEGMVALPTLPLVASRLLESIADPDAATSEEIGAVIALDPALTARTLKLANSDFYGFPRKVGTVELAVVVLGADTIRDLVLGAAVFQTLDPTWKTLTGLWSHSLACGVAARALADRCRYRLDAEAFAAGMLHDIGKVVLRQTFPERYEAAVALVREQGISMVEAERGVLGSDHAEVGGWLAERWGLPGDLVEAIAYHHRPEQARLNPELTSIVHIADSLAGRTGNPWPLEAKNGPVSQFAWECVEAGEIEREALLEDLVPFIQRAVRREQELFRHFRGPQEIGT
ncbi:MAG TPA: HDOD domain-containing protein [Candidatus Limnocylindrales bacterium]|nr:HDOD domain-containing protein [Candidatus Limnocylindrales bacterium]